MGATPCAGSWWTSLARSTLPSLVGVHVGGCVCWWCSGICESCCCREACTEEIALGRPAGRMGHTSGRVECQSACHRMKVRSGTYPCVCMMPNCGLSLSPTPPTGEEKETRDGHYDYSTQGVFHVVAPLSCHNQAAVVRWLDERVVHKGQAAAAATGKLPGNFHTAGQYGRSGGVRAGRKPGSDLARAAALKKWRTAHGGAVPGADPAQEARDALAAELRAWAREEAGARSAARRRALAWASDPAPLAALAAAEEAVDLLRGGSGEDRASVQRGANGRGGAAGLAAQADGVRARVRLLALLRQLAHSYAPLALAAAPGLQAALAAAPASPLAGPEVAALASWILQAWASALGCHLAVLTQERYVRDPGAELEAALGGRRAWLDAAAAAVTHRRVGQGAQEARAGREPAGGGDKGVGDGTAEGKGGDSAAVAETAAAETAAAETEPENEEGSGSEGEAMDAEEAAE